MKQSIFFVCILWIAGFVACSKNDDSAIPDTSSNINVFVGVPGGHFDVAIDSSFIGLNIGEGTFTGYKSFRAERHTLYIYEVGNRTTPIDSGDVNMRNGFHYSAFISLDHTNTLQLWALEDALAPLPAQFTGKIRVVNLSDTYNSNGDALSLDFYVSDLIDTARFQNINYQAKVAFSDIQAGSYKRDIRLAGTTQSLLGKIPQAYTVVDGKFTSWIVYGNALKSDSFKLAAFTHN